MITSGGGRRSGSSRLGLCVLSVGVAWLMLCVLFGSLGGYTFSRHELVVGGVGSVGVIGGSREVPSFGWKIRSTEWRDP